MGIFNKKKQTEQKTVEKKPTYKKLTTITEETNNDHFKSNFGSKTNLLQEQQLNPDNLDEIIKEVEGAKDIMKKNIETIENRGENLKSLEDKAERTEESAEQLRGNTRKINKKLRHENRMLKIFTYTICFFITLFFSYIAFSIKEQDSGVKVLYFACSCLSALCIGYLAANDCKNAFDFCLKKISCCNKENKQEGDIP